MNLAELQDLDLKDVSSWPIPVKVVAVVLLSVIVIIAGYFLDTRAQLDELSKIEAVEEDLKIKLQGKFDLAINLDSYRQQMEEIKRSFGTMLRQLPSKTEVPDLLVDISQTGRSSGLNFDLFKPESETSAEFYAELPITIKVNGSYHEFGRFVSAVASLPRIVTLHDVSISQLAGKKNRLVMGLTAKTYHYLDDDVRSRKPTEKGKSK